MEWLYAWLPLVGCAAMMFVCMKMMGGGRDSDESQPDEAAALRGRVAELERRLQVESTAATVDAGNPDAPVPPTRG